MKRALIVGLLGLATLGRSAAADDPFEVELNRWRQNVITRQAKDEAPKLDPKRIINESNSFLKEREPEMTSEEYAIYQKMTSILTGNPELAIKFLEGMVNEKEPPSPAFEFILGNAYYAAGQNDKAEAHYRSGLKRYPTFLRAWNNLGVLYYSTERYAEAVPCFTESVNLGDREAMTFGLLGYALEKTGNIVVAEMAYMQALQGAPANADWKQGLLRIAIEAKQYGRAATLARALIKEHPTETRYWLTYANVLLADHRKPAAIALLEVAVNHGLAGQDELALLGDLYAEQMLLPEAVATYQRLFAIVPAQGTRRLLRLAEVLIAAGKLTEAEATLRPMPAPTAIDEQIAWRQVRTELLLAQKNWPEARRELDEIQRAAPMDGRLLLSLGLSYKGEDDLERAALAFEAASRIPGTTYRASLELANIALRNRNYAQSLDHLERAYRLERTDAIADLIARVRTLAGENE